MAKRMASYFPQGARLAVRSATLIHGVENEGATYMELGAPAALNTALLVAAQDMTAAGSTNPLTNSAPYLGTEAQMGRFGRAVQVVASGAASNVVTVRGRDYLGQYVREDITLNGTTPVSGKKAFRYVDSVAWLANAAMTLSVGTTNVLGLPYKMFSNDHEIKNQAPASNAGTFVAGLSNATVSTATSADVRGTYTPSTVVPDGVNTFALRAFIDNNNGHGNSQFYS